jgi:hypothetical protein
VLVVLVTRQRVLSVLRSRTSVVVLVERVAPVVQTAVALRVRSHRSHSPVVALSHSVTCSMPY